MKTKLKLLLLLLTLLSLSGFAHAQGTAISYQGRLNDGSLPATGLYDFTFHVFDAEVDGTDLAGPLGPLPYDAVPVTNGLFNVILDFGPDIFSGPAHWLEISVRTNGVGDPSLLAPRTPLLPTPYAIFAGKAGGVANGTVTADQLNSGGVPPAPGQFLSYDGGNFLWRDGVESVWLLNGTDAYYNAGNVGIGTSSPTPGVRLEVNGTTRVTTGGSGGFVSIGTPNGESGMGILGANRADLRFDGSTLKLVAGIGSGPPPSTHGIAINTTGNVGVGTVNPVSKLHVFDGVGDRGTIHVGGTLANGDPKLIRFGDGDFVHLGENGQDDTLEFKATRYRLLGGDINYDGRLAKLDVADSFASYIRSADLYFGHSSRRGSPGRALVDLGNRLVVNFDNDWGYTVIGGSVTEVKTLRITGGADLAEPFQMKEVELAKGSVVVIDDEHPGRLKRSTRAYDTRVAGIISGANGVNPGIALHQEGVLEGGQNVSLSGRVYVRADAAFGAIKPGDLLTTSDTPGHAMKVTEPGKAQGAILGKAMSELKTGKGMVLVLVTLQ